MEPCRCSKKGFSGTGIAGKFRHLITERSKLCLNKMSITSYIKLKGDVASQYFFLSCQDQRFAYACPIKHQLRDGVHQLYRANTERSNYSPTANVGSQMIFACIIFGTWRKITHAYVDHVKSPHLQSPSHCTAMLFPIQSVQFFITYIILYWSFF